MTLNPTSIAAEPSTTEDPADAADRRFAEDLAELIAPRHGRVALSVFAENRDPATVAARRDVARMLRSIGWSLPRIGRALGDRHHTTVMHLLKERA